MEEHSMRLRTFLLTGFCVLFVQSVGEAADQVSFLNKTTSTIGELHLAKPNSEIWGPNQLASGEVPSNERISLPDVQPGDYDLKVHVKFGPTCIIHKVAVKSGESFSVGDS